MTLPSPLRNLTNITDLKPEALTVVAYLEAIDSKFLSTKTPQIMVIEVVTDHPNLLRSIHIKTWDELQRKLAKGKHLHHI